MSSTRVTEPPATTVRAAGRHHVAPRTMVAAGWLFVSLCYLYCDVLGLYDVTATAELSMSQAQLLAASLLMTVPLGLTAAVRVVRRSIARPASIAGAALMTVVQLGSLGVGTAPTASYLYFSVIELTTTVFLVWYGVRRWVPEG